MTDTLTRLLKRTRALESRLTTAFERTALVVAGEAAETPLEVIDRAVGELARQVQPAGRGRYACPFNRVELVFVAATASECARFEALSAGPPSLRERMVQRLAAAGCPDADLEVAVRYVAAPDPGWADRTFHLAMSREDREPAGATGPTPRIDALVTHGAADRGAYSFSTLPIAIGRGAEVRDARLQLLRVNHIAFTDIDDEVNRSVSRRHARIELDAASGRLRLIDDNSARGTSIVRAGRGLAVPRGSRGLSLQSDDEIVVGLARLRVRLGDRRARPT